MDKISNLNGDYLNFSSIEVMQHLGASIESIGGSVFLSEQVSSKERIKIPATGKRFVSYYMSILAKNYHRQDFNHLEAANLLSISHRHMHRKLLSFIGMNFSLSLRKYRLRKAASFCHSDLQINQIVDKVGFSSCSYFVKCFKDEFGVTPKQYQSSLD